MKTLFLLSTLCFSGLTCAIRLTGRTTGEDLYHDYGELRIAITSKYKLLWNDAKSGAQRDVSVWSPSMDGDFRALGSIAESTHNDVVNGERATIMAALNPNQKPQDESKPALKPPTSWTQLWNDTKSQASLDGAFWRPVCPDGYVSLGDVGSVGYKEPMEPVWCLRKDLAKQGMYKQSTLWDDRLSGVPADAFLWEIVPRSVGVNGAKNVPLYAGTFRVVNTSRRPNVPAWTISIELPKDYSPFTPRAPEVTADTIPSKGDVYEEIGQADITLPLTALFPPKDDMILDNLHAPFANVSKSTSWYVEGVWSNDSPGTEKHTDTVNYGFSQSKTESMEHKAGISITAKSGIGLVDTSVSLNYQFTASQSSTFGEYKSYTKTEEFDVPPHHFTVMFCKRILVKVTLQDGAVIHQDDNLASGEFHLSGDVLPARGSGGPASSARPSAS